jgi:outer membrane protein OmpA-like peptidoglycan-associated protein
MKSLPTSLFAGALAILGSGVAVAETAPSKVEGAPTSEIFFDFDSARLDEATADKLAPIVEFAKSNPKAKIVLDANTDPTGASTYNVKLATRRGEVVRDRLVLAGIAQNQIVVGVYGEDGVRRGSHAEDRRVSIWMTEDALPAIIDHTFARGTAVIWSKPVDATALAPAAPINVSFR